MNNKKKKKLKKIGIVACHLNIDKSITLKCTLNRITGRAFTKGRERRQNTTVRKGTHVLSCPKRGKQLYSLKTNSPLLATCKQ